ncbi:MAG: 30S ribosomal protein S7 [Gemmatimonadetes bacterium]|nr:30S ribosomal protein S7 [Gemmatimonadota bacterium]
MSRRTRAVRRQIPEDPNYGSHVVQKFINGLMLDGKKSLAERTFYEAMGIVEAKAGQPPINIFRQALTNAKPALEVKSRRVGGATYQVPIEVRPERRQALAIKWLIGFARQRGERTMAQRLAAEVLSASRGEGATVKKKDDTHRMAEANKAFAHYRW